MIEEVPEWKMRGILGNARQKAEAEHRITAAAESLKLEGQPITVRSVRAKVGCGSHTTILRILNRLKEAGNVG